MSSKESAFDSPRAGTLTADVADGGPHHHRMPLHVVRHGEHTAELVTDNARYWLEVLGEETVGKCIEDLEDDLLDAIASRVVASDTAELLFIRPSSGERVWVCRMFQHGQLWGFSALDTKKPGRVSTDYALPENPDQLQELTAVYEAFMTFAGSVLRPEEAMSTPTLLRVKVDPREHWFLRFPLGVFAKFRFPGFARYSGCQWIVTDRTFTRVAATQAAIENEMAETSTFLSGTHILFNTYNAHAAALQAPSTVAGFDLILALLNQLHDVPLRDELLCLKWTMNPDPQRVCDILLSPDTRFVFANFEASGGTWTTGDGPTRSWRDDVQAPSSPGIVEISALGNRLGHVRLMRVFHCNSLYDPFKSAREPMDAGTIASALLATSAFFVEGSVTAEPVIDFICTILTLLLGRPDLRTILFAQSLAGRCEVPTFIARANQLLLSRSFPAIS